MAKKEHNGKFTNCRKRNMIDNEQNGGKGKRWKINKMAENERDGK